MRDRVGIEDTRQAVCTALKTGVLGALLVALLASGWTSAQEAPQEPRVVAGQDRMLELMKSKGPEASLTILPIRLTGNPSIA